MKGLHFLYLKNRAMPASPLHGIGGGRKIFRTYISLLMPHLFLIFAIVLIFACSGTNPVLESQKTKVAQAQKTLREELIRLQTLRDSLQSEIRRNIALGIPKEQAEQIEHTRIKIQETIVVASERNLVAQRALLDSLTKYAP